MEVKAGSKRRCASWLDAKFGVKVDSTTVFDCHIKRIHEYKRQLLNVLRIVVLYNRLGSGSHPDLPARTFFFAGKAAPAYRFAKLIIKFLDSVGRNIAAAHEAGEDNFLLFGLTAEQVVSSRAWYDPRWHHDNDPDVRAALDLIGSGHFSGADPDLFRPLHDMLLNSDHYMHLADLSSYLEADRRLCAWYAEPRL